MLLSHLATRAVGTPRNVPSTRPCVAPAAALRRLHPMPRTIPRAAAVDAPAPAAEEAHSEAVHADDGSPVVVQGPQGRYQLRVLTAKLKEAVAKYGRSSFILRMPPARIVSQQYNTLFRSIAYANKASLNIMKEVTTVQPRTVPEDGSAELALGKAPGNVVSQLRASGTKDPKQLAADAEAAAAYAADPANAPTSPPVHLKRDSAVKVTAGWSGAATLESIVKPLLLSGEPVAVDVMDETLLALLGQLITIRTALAEHRELGDLALVVDTEMVFPDMLPGHTAAPQPAAGAEARAEEGKDNKVLPNHRFVLYVLRCEVDSPQSLVTSPVPAEHVEKFLATAAKAFA